MKKKPTLLLTPNALLMNANIQAVNWPHQDEGAGPYSSKALYGLFALFSFSWLQRLATACATLVAVTSCAAIETPAPLDQATLRAFPAMTVAPGEKGLNSYGYGADHVGYWWTSADEDYTGDDMKRIGTQWVRFSQSMATLERTKGSFDWSYLDRVVPKMVGRGLKPMFVINFDTPSWARPGNSNPQTVPTDLAGFADFCTKIAQRYAPQGIHAWEIFNEPIYNNTPVQYGPALKAAYQAIKAIDPGAEIILGGNPLDDQGHGTGVQWLQGLYGLGYGPYFTAVGAHPYDYQTLPSQGGNWLYMEGNNPSMRTVMIAHGDNTKKIWVTEYGYASCNPSNSGWTEQQEARYLQDAYTTLKKKMWAGPLFWYSYHDSGTTNSTRENCYGIVHHDFMPKTLPYNAYNEVSTPGKSTN